MTVSPVIIDCGSGYTKVGIAGEDGPRHVIPTLVYRQDREHFVRCQLSGTFPLTTSLTSAAHVVIGKSAVQAGVLDAAGVSAPIAGGRVVDWSDIEYFLHGCFSQYLRLDPSQRPCVLTEPPLNSHENREQIAEVMFETFSAPSLFIGVQPVLALYSYWDACSPMTGLVVDSGDGATHIFPVTDGYVSGASVRELPLAGKDVTRLIADHLVQRGEVVGMDRQAALSINRFAKQIKEKLSYVCNDPLRELRIYDNDKSSFKSVTWTDPSSNKASDCEVGYERFLGPEIFFQPVILSFYSSHYAFLGTRELQCL